MKKILAILVLAPSLAWATPSGYGTCTKAVNVATSSTAVLSHSIAPPDGRHLLILQNTGANPAYCTIGNGVTATTTNGYYLAPLGGSFQIHAYEGPNGVFYLAPGDDVTCIATTGATTVIACDY